MPESKFRNDSLEMAFRRVADGDSDSANELYSRLRNMLAAYLRKNRAIGKHLRPDVHTTEVAHDALAELFNALEAGKFTYQGERPLLAWLIRVMLHSIADAARTPRMLALPPGEILEDKSAPEQMVILADVLKDASDGLDELSAQVFQLWLDECPQREIARRLDCSRHRVHRILELLAHRLHHRLCLDDI
jgi:RNA polymerase sigma factor (sigma-70 family)